MNVPFTLRNKQPLQSGVLGPQETGIGATKTPHEVKRHRQGGAR